MANIFKSIVNSLKLQDDTDDDNIDFDDETEKDTFREKSSFKDRVSPIKSTPERERSYNAVPKQKSLDADVQPKSSVYSQRAHTASNYNSSTYIENSGSGKSIRMERPDGSKVIPIRTTQKGLEVCIMKPKCFEDSQDICDVLLSGRAAVINLEDFDVALAQRIMDFISGAVYSMNGKLYTISGFIFIVSPESVDISGDYSDILEQTGFEVPTLSKEY